MVLWLILAAMTAAAALVALLPLSRRRVGDRADGDAAVYRDQIAEIERDKARGLIGGKEAEAARAEVARRLFAATEAEAAARGRVTSEAATLRRR
ncbi:c-type cytochrome biogenesis protein CcmI, partial [Methylopila musalis]